MPDLPVITRPRTALLCVCLIAAPLAETVEQLLSPLTGGSTADDLAAIAAAPERFLLSVLIGLLATALLLPALLGLAHRTSERSPLLALFASIAIGASLLGFAGVRMSQGFEYAFATGGASPATAAAQFEAAIAAPIGMVMTIAFLAGTVIGIVLLAIGLWRSRRVPVGSIILLLLFPVADLTAPAPAGPVISHLILLAALTWMAIALLRTAPARRAVHASAPADPRRAHTTTGG
ncbi:MAG: hypothetical protein JSS74_16610 [Actinobacteria bacterium]|nr:hypothetical protein [Actinomycetota bacterium]